MSLDTEKKVVEQLISALTHWDNLSALGMARILRLRLEQPESFVTLAGETSAGKTTLINSFFGKKLLPVSTRPTTGTVLQVRCIDASNVDYWAINEDGSEEEIDADLFRELSVTPDESLKRLLLRYASPEKKGLNLFDTPGYNSVIYSHTEVLTEFLPESDVILFVCGYRSGFGQNEQDLLELIRESTELDPGMPVIVVVNRVPKGTPRSDKRIVEIMNNAKDCLYNTPPLILIESRNPDLGLPDTDTLWDFVYQFIQDPKRSDFVNKKIMHLSNDLCIMTKQTVQQRLLTMGLSESEREFFVQELKRFMDVQKKGKVLIDECEEKLKRRVPDIVKQQIAELKSSIEQEISSSDKWLGKEHCVDFLREHSLPIGVKRISKQVEHYVVEQLEILNEKLSDLINTAMEELENRVKLKNAHLQDLILGIGRRLTEEMAGHALLGFLKGMGGVGGAAAGAGNLVKKGLKEFGLLFGKRFGREVYREIGRFFNKEMMKRLGLIFSVVIEAILFIYEANTWKGKVNAKVSESLDNWEEEVSGKIETELIPKIIGKNRDSFNELLETMKAEIDDNLKADQSDSEKNRLQILVQELESIEQKMGALL